MAPRRLRAASIGDVCDARNICSDDNSYCLAVNTYDDNTNELLSTEDICHTKGSA